MAAGLPYTWVHKDGSVKANDVVVHPCHFLPPEVTDIILQLNAHRTVVICAVKSTVDFGRLEDEAPASAERDDFVHCNYVCHSLVLLEKTDCPTQSLFCLLKAQEPDGVKKW